jgi:hypothetical protein
MVFDGLKDDLVEIWFAVRNSIRVCHEQIDGKARLCRWDRKPYQRVE